MKLTLTMFKDEYEYIYLPFPTTVHKPLFTLRLLDCCVSSVKKYLLGTSKCHDHDTFTLQQPIRLQHFERGNKKI